MDRNLFTDDSMLIQVTNIPKYTAVAKGRDGKFFPVDADDPRAIGVTAHGYITVFDPITERGEFFAVP